MKKTRKWMLAIGLMVVALTGCQANVKEKESISTTKLPEQATEIMTESQEQKVDTADSVNDGPELLIAHEKCIYMTSDGTDELLTVELAIPCITKGSEEVTSNFNAQYEIMKTETMDRMEGKNETFTDGVGEHLLQSANEEYNLYKTDDMFVPFHYLEGYGICRFDEKVLSMTNVIEVYSGAAHGSEVVTGVNVDMQTGVAISLQDITTDSVEFYNVCEAEICKQIEEKKQQGVEFYETCYDFVREIIADSTFYLTDEAVCFISQEYMLQPYVSGTVHFAIPYEVLGSLMNEAYLPENGGKKGTVIEEETVVLPDKLYELNFEFDVATPMLNQILSRIGLGYMYEGTEKITTLTDEAIVGMVASAIGEDFGYDEDWYVETVGGYTIPQDVFDRYTMDLFGKTVDLKQFAENQQLGMALISSNHECIVLVGDWGMSCPVYEMTSFDEQPNGTYLAHMRYGITDYEEQVTTEYVVEGKIEFSPCEEAKYGYVITKIDLADMK